LFDGLTQNALISPTCEPLNNAGEDQFGYVIVGASIPAHTHRKVALLYY